MKAKNVKYLILSMIVIVGGSLFAKQSMAEGGYGSISMDYIDTDVVNFWGSTAAIGYEFNDFAAVQGECLIHSSEEAKDGVKLTLEKLCGVYAIGTVPVTDSWSVFIRYGHSWIEAEASYNGYSDTADESDTSLGFGIRYEMSENWRATFQRTEVVDGVDVTSAALTFVF